jgi:hypothetical protein
MRNLIFTATILLAATTTYANTNPTISLNEGKILVVNLNDWANSDVSVSIQDQDGLVLHNDNFQTGTTLGRKYNLKNLPLGTYNLIIENSTKKAIHELTVDENSVSMEPLPNALAYIPFVDIKENTISLNQLTLGNDLSVFISDNKNTFFEKTFSNENTVNQKFDINSLPRGKYEFSIQCNNEYYSFPFVK